MYDAIIIGGGASGLTAAITAKRRGKSVLVMECTPRVGRKLTVAGNGKCNVSNTRISPEFYNNPFVEKFLDKSEKVTEFFEYLGLKTRVIDGRVYPYSESGNAVLNLLRSNLGEDAIKTETLVENIKKTDYGFSVNGIKAKKIILATGSEATFGKASYFLAEKLGHKTTPLQPVLVPLKTDTFCIKGLSGIRVKVAFRAFCGKNEVFCDKGEVLFKDNGLSGIVAMEASRHIDGEKVTVSLDLAPEMSENEVKEFLFNHSIEGLTQRVVGEALERQARDIGAPLYKVVKDFRIGGAEGLEIKSAQVMRGGLCTDEFDENLESRITRGFYACGEVLDVDGACGGYNLHWAFLSGIISGENI